jgi:DNA-directed RNA polymerase specialized sigma24 family protein
MQIQVRTDGQVEGGAELAQEVENVVQLALDRFGDRITRVEVYFSDENSSEKFGAKDKRCVIEARLSGLQPITVSHLGSSLDQALNGAAGKLQKTLKRTLRRKDSITKRRIRERAELTAAGALLQQNQETGKEEHFMKVLRPLLGQIGQHVRRELRIMEASGTLYPGQLVSGQLLDDVLARAWLQFADRPELLPLDLWLTKIADEVIEEQVRPGTQKPVSLATQAAQTPTTSSPQVGEQEWWVWLLGEDDGAPEDAAVEDRQSRWAEEFLEAEELMDRIHALLGELPTLQRRAFVLNVLEAFALFEIAMLQDRPEDQVQADIEAARKYLRERLREGGR